MSKKPATTLTTDLVCNKPQAVITMPDGSRVTGMIRPGETPHQALTRCAQESRTKRDYYAHHTKRREDALAALPPE